MREPPPHVTDEDVLATVAEHWAGDLDRIGHLPVGFGAYHWRASGPDTILFVTLDRLGERHTIETLDAAYAGADALSTSGLDFVLAPLATTTGGGHTVPFEGDALSMTPWRIGTTTGDGTMSGARALATRDALDRLHATSPPGEIPRWQPLVDRRPRRRPRQAHGRRLGLRPVRRGRPHRDRGPPRRHRDGGRRRTTSWRPPPTPTPGSRPTASRTPATSCSPPRRCS